MSTYLSVAAEDLNIGDLVKGRGRLMRDVFDHDTLEGHIVATFEKGGEEQLRVIPANRILQVRCMDE